jgi:hypothetical protein
LNNNVNKHLRKDESISHKRAQKLLGISSNIYNNLNSNHKSRFLNNLDITNPMNIASPIYISRRLGYTKLPGSGDKIEINYLPKRYLSNVAIPRKIYGNSYDPIAYLHELSYIDSERKKILNFGSPKSYVNQLNEAKMDKTALTRFRYLADNSNNLTEISVRSYLKDLNNKNMALNGNRLKDEYPYRYWYLKNLNNKLRKT